MSIPVVKIRKAEVTDVFKNLSAENTLTQARSAEDQSHPESMDDIVFKNRNREYGAFALRKGYTLNVAKGLAFTVITVIAIILLPYVSRYLSAAQSVEKTPPRKLVYSELSAPPPIDKVKPPPPAVQLPKLQKVIKFVPPKVVKENVTETVPSIDELRQNETAAVSVEGTDEVLFDEPLPDVVEEVEEIYTVVEQLPEFEGGYEAMMNFIKKNMIYPPSARRMQIEGTVHVSFIVSKTGAISDVKILRGIQTECDREAVRVVGMMPPWKPGKQNGKPVTVRFIMPLKFRMK